MDGKTFPTCTRWLLAIAMSICWMAGSAITAWPQEQIQYRFQNGLDGSQPWGELVADRLGNVYGTTVGGGSSGYGTVFELSPPQSPTGSWTETVLYSFQGGTDGAQPYAGLVLDQAGNLYGTTRNGGQQPDCFGCGTVFKLSPPRGSSTSWSESVLYSFDGADGAYPYARLVRDDDGNLYGTTSSGGANFNGSVFKLIRPDDAASVPWREKTLYSFSGGADGAIAYSGLVWGKGGSLYGTTNFGGANNQGVVYQLTRANSGGWVETVIYSFTGGNDGASPYAGVVFDGTGRLYGATEIGGNSVCPGGGCGTIFRLTPGPGGSWSERTLYMFTGGADGGQPFGNLLLGSNGAIYGTATVGGPASPDCFSGCGTVFELTPATAPGGTWSETTLHDFSGGTDGSYPIAGVIRRSNGTLYGVTVSSGDAEGDGVFFSITP